MLSRLSVRNFAIIDELELEFRGGLTVLTGETGAGKSILVDALGLVLGDRADTSVVPDNAARAEISAVFDIAAVDAARQWLTAQALDASGEECVLRRVIGADGRSRAYINASSVSLQSLKQLGEHLVEIHGQHAHQSLTRPGPQRDLIDQHGKLQGQLQETADSFRTWQDQERRLRELIERRDARDDRLEFLRFQISELDAVNDVAANWAELTTERDRLANAHRLADAANRALDAIFENEEFNAQTLIAEASRALGEVAEFDITLASSVRLLDEAEVSLTEAAGELRRYRDSLEPNPERRDELEAVLGNLANLARKHRASIDELPTEKVRLQRELDDLVDAETRIGELQSAVVEARQRYEDSATRLSVARSKTASAFEQAVTAAMQRLGMQGGEFRVEVRSVPARARATGFDSVTFQVCANPGQPLKPLAKVASGGELSRISLAIQVIASDVAAAPSVIFDEIDSGVGGGVAEIVGRRLRELSDARQVLCVTHLPQVASQGHQHLRVSKVSDGRSTRTALTDLSAEERVEEIARMLGGIKITERTLAHAREMLNLRQRQRA